MITTNHRGLDAEDADEIADLKRRLDLLKQENAKRNGVAHPDKAPGLDPADLDAELPEGASHEHRSRTRKAKRKGRPIDPDSFASQVRKLAETEPNLTPMVICERLGIAYDESNSKKVNNVLYKLRKAGKIPARDGRPAEEYPALRARIMGEEPRPTAPVVTSREPSDQEKVAKACLCADKGRITVRKLILATGLSSQRVYAAVIALKRQGAFPYELVEGKSATSRLPDNKPVRLREGARSRLLQRMEESEADDEEEDHPPIEDLVDVDPVEEDGAVPACVDDDQVDPELLAMNRLLRELKSWDPDARRRIVSYLADRLGPIPQL